MKRTRLLWPIAGIAALLSTLLFIFGFAYAVREILYPQPDQAEFAPPAERQPLDPLARNNIQIVALGDSLTKGVGDEAGEGYVGKVKRMLEQDAQKPVYVWNYAVNGARTQQLLSYLEAGSSADYVRQANIILLTIGGNDLNQFVTAPGGTAAAEQTAPDAARSQAASPAPDAASRQPTAALPAAPAAAGPPGPGADALAIPYDEIRKKLPDVLARLEQIIGKLVQLNPEAKIVYVGLYHPYLDYDPDRKGAAIIQEWNFGAAQIANRYPNVTVVPTFDLFQNHLNELLFGDHFHPNGRGYERMAERVIQVLK